MHSTVQSQCTVTQWPSPAYDYIVHTSPRHWTIINEWFFATLSPNYCPNWAPPIPSEPAFGGKLEKKKYRFSLGIWRRESGPLIMIWNSMSWSAAAKNIILITNSPSVCHSFGAPYLFLLKQRSSAALPIPAAGPPSLTECSGWKEDWMLIVTNGYQIDYYSRIQTQN